MEITVLTKPIDGKLEMVVQLYECPDGLGRTVTASVWVPETDSRSALEHSAREAAIVQLRRALTALEQSV